MRIGIDAHGVGGRSLGCGNETYFENLIKHLLQIDRENEYHIFTNHPESFEDRLGKHSNAYYVSLRPRSQWIQRPVSLPWYVNRRQLDLLHVPFVRPPFLRSKCIITVHDVCFETHPEHFRKVETLRMRALIPASCRRADCIFTVSDFARKQIHELYGIPLHRIVVTPNAADHIAPALPGIADVPSSDITAPYILYAGLLQPRKNLVRLVRAFERLMARHDLPHHLVLCGKWGWGNDDLRACIAQSPLQDRIYVPGYVPTSQLQALMRGASIFAFPSIFEGFGIPPLEAQRCQVPVVVSRASCFPEIYGDSAEYCDPLDINSIGRSLERILFDKSYRQLLIERGAQNWRRYSWSQTATLVREQYLSIHSNGYPAAATPVSQNTAEAF